MTENRYNGNFLEPLEPYQVSRINAANFQAFIEEGRLNPIVTEWTDYNFGKITDTSKVDDFLIGAEYNDDFCTLPFKVQRFSTNLDDINKFLYDVGITELNLVDVVLNEGNNLVEVRKKFPMHIAKKLHQSNYTLIF